MYGLYIGRFIYVGSGFGGFRQKLKISHALKRLHPIPSSPILFFFSKVAGLKKRMFFYLCHSPDPERKQSLFLTPLYISGFVPGLTGQGKRVFYGCGLLVDLSPKHGISDVLVVFGVDSLPQ